MSAAVVKSPDEISTLLTELLGDTLGPEMELTNLRRLNGGASMESWSFDNGDRGYILRRLPGEGNEVTGLGSISIEAEAEVIHLVGQHGVAVPEVVAILPAGHALGRGFVMSRVAGEALATIIQKKPEFQPARDKFLRDCAHQLARLHSIDPAEAPEELNNVSASGLLKETRDFYHASGAQSTIFEMTFHWLENNMPKPSASCIVHADFRIGNFLVEPDSGMSAVLDWETASIGDPARDIAYLCVPSWRFLNHDQPAAGVGTMEEWVRAYEDASGRSVDMDNMRFWLVLSTLWWGVVCLRMIGLWRSGDDRSLERCIIGTRVSEVELDLLRLLEDIEGWTAPAVAWDAPGIAASAGATQADEITVALSEWITENLLPSTTGNANFEARVARNALGIVKRKLQLDGPNQAARAARCTAMGTTQAALFEKARLGQLTTLCPKTLTHLRLSVLESVSTDQPRYPGFAPALRDWTIPTGEAQ